MSIAQGARYKVLEELKKGKSEAIRNQFKKPLGAEGLGKKKMLPGPQLMNARQEGSPWTWRHF